MVQTETFGARGFTEEARTFYVMELLNRARPTLRHAGYGIQKAIPRRGGVAANFRRLEQYPADVSWITPEGTPPAKINVTWVSSTLTVQQHGAYDHVSDLAWTQSIDEVIGEMTMMFAGQMGRTIDFLARDVIIAGTNVAYVTGSAATALSLGNVLTGTLLAQQVAQLKKRGASPLAQAGGRYACIVHPDTYADLLVDSTVAAALQYAAPRGGDNPLFTGGEFDFAGARIIESANAKVLPSGGLSVNIAVYKTLLMGEGYYGEVTLSAQGTTIKVKDPGSAGAADPMDQYGSVAWKTTYVAGRLNEAFAQRIEHTTAKNDTAILPYPTT